MAIITIRPVSFNDGASYAEYDYDDTTGEILVVRCVNNSSNDLWIHVFGTADSGAASNVDYQRTFTAGSGTTEFQIPVGQRKQFRLEPSGDGGSPTLGGLAVEASG